MGGNEGGKGGHRKSHAAMSMTKYSRGYLDHYADPFGDQMDSEWMDYQYAQWKAERERERFPADDEQPDIRRILQTEPTDKPKQSKQDGQLDKQ